MTVTGSGRNPAEVKGTFDVAEYARELAAAPDNHEIGTRLLLENEHVRIFEVRLAPGERGPFHIHDRPYFWTVVDAGRGLQRYADGSCAERDYRVGDTKYLVHSPTDSLIHDLENVGHTTLRFVTVELKH